MVKLSDYFLVEYLYKYVKYHGFTWQECAETIKEDLFIPVSPEEIEDEFRRYYEDLEFEKNR